MATSDDLKLYMLASYLKKNAVKNIDKLDNEELKNFFNSNHIWFCQNSNTGTISDQIFKYFTDLTENNKNDLINLFLEKRLYHFIAILFSSLDFTNNLTPTTIRHTFYKILRSSEYLLYSIIALYQLTEEVCYTI
jgi:hypothetical protein